MLSQLNRDADQQGRRPRNNDLRDSDYLGIGGKQVWLLDYPWRMDLRPAAANDSDYNVRVSKDNSGLEGTAHLSFTGGYSLFAFNMVCRGGAECPVCATTTRSAARGGEELE
jgi:replicative DNA helicase